jgi:hypothetical protein
MHLSSAVDASLKVDVNNYHLRWHLQDLRLRAVVLKIHVLWDFTLHRLVNIYKHLEGSKSLNLHSPLQYFEMSISTDQSTCCNTPKTSIFNVAPLPDGNDLQNSKNTEINNVKISD